MVGADPARPVVNARTVVLGRLRRALQPGVVPEPIVRAYRQAGPSPPGAPALLDRLQARLLDLGAGVRRTAPDTVAEVIAALLAARGATTVVVPAGLPRTFVPGAVVDAADRPAPTLDQVDLVVTGCAVAIAETGTLVLDGSPDQGRRALTLVPDWHIAVVAAARVVETLPEAIARLDPTRPLTFISGPSATSDIEFRRVEGVHGPRTLDVILVTTGG